MPSSVSRSISSSGALVIAPGWCRAHRSSALPRRRSGARGWSRSGVGRSLPQASSAHDAPAESWRRSTELPASLASAAETAHDGAAGGTHAGKSHARRSFRDRGDARRFAAVRRSCLGRVAISAARLPGPAAAADGRIRRRDHDRVAQRAGRAGDPRREAGRRGRAPGQRRAGGRGRQAPGPLRRRRRAADAGPGASRRRSSSAASRSSASRARWSTASRRSERPTPRSTTICRNTGRSGRGREARRSVLSASAPSACRAASPLYDGHPWLLGPTWGFAAETACMRCG